MLVRATADRFTVTRTDDVLSFEVEKLVHRHERIPSTRPASSPR
jgi:hypothetical protein